ncbi:hypothetical protein D3C72_1607610 [compost metagenome]
MSDTMRDSRCSSSTLDASTSRYLSASRGCDSTTWVCVIRLVMGVRSSCARSDENSDRRAKSRCRRSSMALSVAARSAISTGTASTGMRSSSLCAVTVRAREAMVRNGESPRRAAHQPSSPLASAASAA